MVQLAKEQRTFVVLKYQELKSFVAVQNAFRRQFPDRDPPTKSTIWKNVQKYRTEGTGLNVNKQRSDTAVCYFFFTHLSCVFVHFLVGRSRDQHISCKMKQIGIIVKCSNLAFNSGVVHSYTTSKLDAYQGWLVKQDEPFSKSFLTISAWVQNRRIIPAETVFRQFLENY